MLAKIVRESLTRRRRRKLLSVLAVALGTAVAAALGTMALDVGDKVGRELRSFGANISVTPAADRLAVAVGGVDYRPVSLKAGGAYLEETDLVKLKQIFWRNNILAFAPLLYVPIRVRGQKAVLIGTWFDKELPVDRSEIFRTGLKRLHPTWKVYGEWSPDQDSGETLVGRLLAERLGTKPGELIRVESTRDPSKGGWTAKLRVRGILETGGSEDDQLIAPLATVQKLSGLEGRVQRIEVSALTKPEDAFARSDITKLGPQEFDRWYCSPYARSMSYQISQAIPGAVATPVYKVADTEGKVLDRVGVLMAILGAAALATAALAVASMMLANVLERRVEIGLFKSLGATDADVAAIFLVEALVVALVGGIVGWGAGSLLAQRLAVTVFGVPVGVHWVILPATVSVALGVTLAGCAWPLAQGLKVSPATVLRD